MKISLKIVLAFIAFALAVSASDLNFSVKISPGNPVVGEPVVYEAVPDAQGAHQISWRVETDVFAAVKDAEPYLGSEMKFTNVFRSTGEKTVNAVMSRYVPESSSFAVTYRQITFRVTNSKDTEIKLRTPNGGELWLKDQTQEILWTSVGTAKKVRIDLYSNGVLLAVITPETSNTGSFKFPLKNWPVNTNTPCKIIVTPIDGGVSGKSQNEFTVSGTSWGTTRASIRFSRADRKVWVRYRTKPDAIYKIQGAFDLKNPDWKDVGLPATSYSVAEMEYPVEGNLGLTARRFYRVVEVSLP